MLYNAKLSQDMARDLYEEGVYVIGFFYPVVGRGLARIRCQMSAGHDFSHIDKTIDAFTKIGKKYDILGKSKEEIIAMYGE
jgi:glycine C-acetyltransferase